MMSSNPTAAAPTGELTPQQQQQQQQQQWMAMQQYRAAAMYLPPEYMPYYQSDQKSNPTAAAPTGELTPQQQQQQQQQQWMYLPPEYMPYYQSDQKSNPTAAAPTGELTPQQQQQQQQQQWMAMQEYLQGMRHYRALPPEYMPYYQSDQKSNPTAAAPIGELTPQQQQQQQQQQWMAMQQYPAAAMYMPGMQQYAMYLPPEYMPYYQQQQQQYQQASQGQIQSSSEDNKTIWIGDLQIWMDEQYLQACFAPTGEAVSVKLIRNKQTGQSERFGFIEFLSHAAAEKILQSYNGTLMPNTDQAFRLNWATFSTGERRQDAGSDQSIFVGDLASDVTDTILHETFASRYSSVRGAKVVVDTNTGRSKGYGFVRFGDENERLRAMTEMNGQYCSSRPMRIGVATPKKPSTVQQQYPSQAVILAGGAAANGALTQGSQSDGDTSNTTVFVGGLDSEVGDEELRHTFSQFGEVISVKIPIGKGCGFVQFADRTSAEVSIEQLNGTVIGKQTVRLSWGRNPGNKQFRGESGNHWNGNSYGKQGYNGYQDPNVYGAAATAYGASANGYGNQ